MLRAGPPRAHLPPGGIPRPRSPGIGWAVDALASPAPRLSPRGSRPASPTRVPFSLPPSLPPSGLSQDAPTQRLRVWASPLDHICRVPLPSPRTHTGQGSGPMSSGPPFPRSTPVKTQKQPITPRAASVLPALHTGPGLAPSHACPFAVSAKGQGNPGSQAGARATGPGPAHARPEWRGASFTAGCSQCCERACRPKTCFPAGGCVGRLRPLGPGEKLLDVLGQAPLWTDSPLHLG